MAAAAPHAANAIAAQYAHKADKEVGDLSIRYSQKARQFLALSNELSQTVGLTAIPYAGGISRADKTSVETNSDRVEPAFAVGMHDHTTPYSTRTVTP